MHKHRSKKRSSKGDPGERQKPEKPVHIVNPDPSPEAVESFEHIGLSKTSALGAAQAGFQTPTDIQKKVIPLLAMGHDIIACSETGSGKTASFVLPTLDLLDYSSPRIQSTVLVPTRELCPQVAGEFRMLGHNQNIRVVEIYGGVSYGGQRNQLAQKPHVLVGTPGRVLDLLTSGILSFKHVNSLILDEADRMLDMGFLPQMTKIIKHVPKKRQSLMFSATIPAGVSHFARICLNDPLNILAGERSKPPVLVKQEAVSLLMREKEDKLVEAVENETGSILVFTSTKVRADDVYRILGNCGHNVCVIHSGMNQSARKKSMDGFRSGKFRIMVGTDVAQRGLDIEGIALVMNFDMPNNAEDYVHRIGRTGRASTAGRALSFVTVHDLTLLRAIERVTGHTFENFIPYSKRNERPGRKRRRFGR